MACRQVHVRTRTGTRAYPLFSLFNAQDAYDIVNTTTTKRHQQRVTVELKPRLGLTINLRVLVMVSSKGVPFASCFASK